MADQQPEIKIVVKKKAGGHGGGHSGGAWKVAYADLVTAMMASRCSPSSERSEM